MDDTALSSGERFTPGEEAWSELRPMREGRFFAARAQLSGYLYLCGGTDSEGQLRSAERFDLREDVWEALPPMAEERCGAAGAAAARGVVVVCGGGGKHANLASVETFDVASGVWSACRPMRYPRAFAFSVVFHGRLYVAGGYSQSQSDEPEQPDPQIHATAECLDLSTGLWDELPPMQGPRIGAAVLVSPA